VQAADARWPKQCCIDNSACVSVDATAKANLLAASLL